MNDASQASETSFAVRVSKPGTAVVAAGLFLLLRAIGG